MIETGLKEHILIRKIYSDDPIPYWLLLDADPSMNAILKYLEYSEIYIALLNSKIIAAIVLCPLDTETMEIKNIAVDYTLQGKGIGQWLLEHATHIATSKKRKTLIIGTSNSSVGQLYLYQKAGFEITDIRYNYFLNHYPEPIFENGIQCKHMFMLAKYIG